MISLHYICMIFFTSVDFLTADPLLISARVGSTAVLPCEWRYVSSQNLQVQWNMDSETVFERKGEQIYEAEGYGDRVDVPQNQLLKGNCSLVLKNVRLSDAGVYESFLSVRRMKKVRATKWILVQHVKVSVDETPEETLQEISANRGTHEEYFYERFNAGAGVNFPHPQIVLLSLLTCLCVLHF